MSSAKENATAPPAEPEVSEALAQQVATEEQPHAETAAVSDVEETTEWVTHDGHSFYTHLYKSTIQPPVATLTIVHGLGEHVDRYVDMARTFARAGIQVLGFDQRGFGKTGRRNKTIGNNGGIANVAQDIEFMSKRVSIDGVPRFLFGHSMGGLNAINYAAKHNSDHNIRGVIASAPALIPGKAITPPGFVISLLKQVVKVFPNIQKDTGITNDMLTSNQAELDKFDASIDKISYCTLSTLADIITTGEELLKSYATSFDTPIFIVHADGDLATNCEGSRRFFAALPEPLDKEFKEIKNCDFHEIHFQEDFDFDLVGLYKQWILDRATGSAN